MISYIFFILLSVLALFCATMISIADFRHRIIPDIYLFPLMLCGLIMTTFYNTPISISDGVIGAAFGYTMSTIIGLAFDYRNRHRSSTPPIGLGDIKLIGVGGIWLGTTGLAIALIAACISGYLWARHQKQHFIPFAPFFILGGILSLSATIFLL